MTTFTGSGCINSYVSTMTLEAQEASMMTKCMIALAAAFIFALTAGIVTADGLAIPQFGHSTLKLQY